MWEAGRALIICIAPFPSSESKEDPNLLHPAGGAILPEETISALWPLECGGESMGSLENNVLTCYV